MPTVHPATLSIPLTWNTSWKISEVQVFMMGLPLGDPKITGALRRLPIKGDLTNSNNILVLIFMR